MRMLSEEIFQVHLDPANSNNLVSDLLTEVEKLRIARTAAISLGIPSHSARTEPGQ